MPSIYIHVGYPKTATTWLQRRVFPFHPEIDYWGSGQPAHRRWIRRILTDSDTEFDAEEMHGMFLAEHRNDARRHLISWESLIGEQSIASRWNPGLCADRMKAVFGEVGIIVTLRSQLTMLPSLYKQYVLEGGDANFKGFLGADGRETGMFDLDNLEYADTIAMYRATFGAEAVLPCLYEELSQTPDRFLMRLSTFMGVKPFALDDSTRAKRDNQNLSQSCIAAMRHWNRILQSGVARSLLPAQRKFCVAQAGRLLTVASRLQSRLMSIADFDLTDSERRFVHNRYRHGNRRLDQETGLDIAPFRYPD